MASQTQSYAPSQSQADRSTLVRRVLRANATISVLLGLLCVLDAAPVAEGMGIAGQTIAGLSGATFITLVGLSFFPFAAAVWFVASRVPLNPRLVWGIIAADAAWVVLSVLALITNVLGLSSAGMWAVLIQGDIVGVLAVLQMIGVRRAVRQ